MLGISVLGLALIITASFSHSYIAFAVPKKSLGNTDHNNGTTTFGSIIFPPPPSSGSTAAYSSNVLTKEELSSLINCLKAANKSEGLTHKVFTNCLDIAKTKSPTLSLLLSLPEQVADSLQNSKVATTIGINDKK